MADIKAEYGANNQTITITIASITNGSGRQSTEIDNTTNLFFDALVTFKAKTNAAGTSATGSITVYAYGTVDGGTTRTDSAGASDAAFTPVNAVPIGVLTANANATTYVGGPFSVAAAFGGRLPDHWGIAFKNNTGATMDSTGGSHSAIYQGVSAQTI